MSDEPCTRIVVGVDFGPSSVAAARWATSIFGNDCEVTLVYALEVPHLPSFLRLSGPGHGEIVEAARKEAERALAELVETLPGKAHEVDVRVGDPAEEITAAAQERGADLVVTGPHGRHSGLRSFLGSTAERLLRVCPVPVLVVTSQARDTPRNILVPVDDSVLARRVLEAARNIARRTGARVTSLHAVHPAIFRRMRMISFPAPDEAPEKRAVIQGEAWLREQLRAASFEPEQVDAQVVVGEPAPEIVAAAARTGADLIVMGSWGAGAPGHFLLGGAVRVVLANAPCPVLVVTDTA